MFCRPWIMSSYNPPPSGWPAAALRPCLARIGALARDRSGMSAVEFGLATPVFLAMLTPVIDLGLAFSQQIRVNQAVEAGAQYATANPYNGSTTTTCDSTNPWSACVQSAMTNATSLSVSPVVGSETCGCPNSTSTAIVTGSYGTPPSCSSSCPDGSSPGYYVTLSASLTYTSVMPYSILGSSTTLSRQAVVRVQ
jgi:Flp pilus assembly protein TadG